MLRAVYGVKGVHVEDVGLDRVAPSEGVGGMRPVHVADGDAEEAIALYGAGEQLRSKRVSGENEGAEAGGGEE